VFEAGQYQFVRKAEDEITLISQELIASQIVQTLCNLVMRLSVQFHDEPLFETAKVRNVGTNGHLALEFQIAETTVADCLPEQRFSTRRLLTLVAREVPGPSAVPTFQRNLLSMRHGLRPSSVSAARCHLLPRGEKEAGARPAR
jgi:hypothetical protein